MKVFDFNKYFPDEDSCRKAFRAMREEQGVVCQHCGSTDVVWLESQALPTPDYAALWYSNAWFQASVPVLVYRHASVDRDKEEHLSG